MSCAIRNRPNVADMLIFRKLKSGTKWKSSLTCHDKCHLQKTNNFRRLGIIQGAMPMRAGIDLANLSDVGCQRDNNEDSYSYWEPADEAQFERKGRLVIVADGMGGHEGGQEASRIAVEAIEEVYDTSAENDPQLRLIEGFRAAHERIRECSLRRPELLGMGTTATAIVLLGHRLYYAHVGDSRLYLVRGSNISRLTHDHTYVGRLVQNGLITSEEAEIHPQRHILTAALGAGAEVEPEFPERPVPLEKDDVLVLCTDGLWGLLSEAEMFETVNSSLPAEACRILIDRAKLRGGPDNITVQVLRVT
jgi:PPM family protein phosphatase